MQASEPVRTASWIPAHPSYAGVSMRRYWSALSENWREGDPYRIKSVIHPQDRPAKKGLPGSAERYWQRNYGYPRVIRNHRYSGIAHVLDHSWSDMLRHIPAGVPKIVTVHDLIPLRDSSDLSPSQLNRYRSWVECLSQADHIISVSHYTKSEVENLLGLDGKNIHVIPNGIERSSSVLSAVAVDQPDSPNPDSGIFRIGSIGSTLKRKNLEIFPEALAKLAAKTKRKIILVRGGQFLPENLANEIRSVLGKDNLIEKGYLEDSELASFYQNVDALVVPSHYEGFGLPLLEAMAEGVPVVSSNTTSMPEVGKDHALYFDPNVPEELAERLAIVANGHLPESWRERARSHASSYTWRTTLEAIYQIYDLCFQSHQKP